MGIDLSNAWKSANRIVNSTVSLLPNLVLAIFIFILFLFIASGAKSLVRRATQRQHRANLGTLLGQLAHVTVAIFGFLVAFSAVAPSFHAADLVKMLGIGSVAIGFAFQNVLQNFLAGILLLFQQPFQIGDWITITGYEGRVEDIQTRATVINTGNNQRIVIPNAVLFTNPVTVGHASSDKKEGMPVTQNTASA